MLNAGLFSIAVMDAYLPRLWKAVYPKIEPHPDVVLRPDGDFGWPIRKDSPKLMAALNAFLVKHKQGTTFGNTLIRKYTASPKMIRSATSGADRKRFDQTAAMFRKYASRYNLDYLLLMAQGYQESRLDQSARSAVGAIGIMQVMPATGRDMKTGDIHQIEPNIHAGAKYVRFMVDEYYAGEPMDELNKVLFAFASYNAGPGRIAQLRRLAAKRGLNPNVWTNNVEAIAAEKVGMETVTYVSNIYRYSVAYHLLTDREEERRKARETVQKTGGS
jgi:membrane-bound lytic murein transglycosylase MltF